MGRSRSRDRHRSRSRSKDRRARRSRSRDRYRSRDSSRDRRTRRRSRSSSRDRDRGRDEGSKRGRSRSRSRDRHRSRRSRSRERKDRDRHRGSKRSPSPTRSKSPAKHRSDSQDSAKRRRLEKLQAWKAQQAAQQQQEPQQSQQHNAAEAPAVWMPWEDPSVTAAPSEAAGKLPAPPTEMQVDDYDEEDQQQVPAAAPAHPGSYVVPADIAMKRAKMSQMEMEQYLRSKDNEDPLDAFMAGEVLPEVQAKQQEEARRAAEEKLRLAQELAASKAAGKVPKRPNIWQDTDSDSEGEPDVEIQIPTNKVKLMIGPGGAKIQEIQKKSKARVQVKKSDEEMNRAFGAGPLAGLKLPKAGEDKPKDMTTVMIFGDSKAVEIAQRMIEEAVENKEAKQKARQREYDRKREQKRRDRQIYHLRHTHDYEALGLPIGSSKAEVKKAYKQLARQWHPDKHPEDPETAKAKFQAIQKAYDSLMSTDEDEHIEQIEAKV